MGNNSYAVIILLGKLIGKTGAVSEKSFELALRKVLPSKYHHMIPEEMDALKMGMNY